MAGSQQSVGGSEGRSLPPVADTLKIPKICEAPLRKRTPPQKGGGTPLRAREIVGPRKKEGSGQGGNRANDPKVASSCI